MKVGDHIVLVDRVNIGDYKRHGIILEIHDSLFSPLVIKFADSIVENYHQDECIVISENEYFKLHLSS